MTTPNWKPIMLTQQNSATSQTNVFTYQLPLPYASNNDEIAIGNLSIPYSWANINSTSYNNASCSYKWVDGNTYSVSFDTGFYLTSDISAYIQQTMYNNKHYLINTNNNDQIVYYMSLTSNYVYYSNTLTCTSVPVYDTSGYEAPSGSSWWSSYTTAAVPVLIISSNNFGLLIGYSSGSYPSTQPTSGDSYQTNGNITPQASPVVNVNVACNMVNIPQFNTYSNVIANFQPNVTYGSTQPLTPPYPIFYECTDGFYQNITVTFYDQDYNNLPMIDNNVVVVLLIRKKQK